MNTNLKLADHEKTARRTCEYKGITYYVLTDMDGRCFIKVDGRKMFLDRNGEVAHKQRNVDSVKTAIENFEDIKKVQDYFLSNKQWNFYLMFTLNINTGRRIEDIRMSYWSDFFKRDGTMKEYWDVMNADQDGTRSKGEKKTKKKKKIYLNEAVREAFRVFLEHEPSIDFRYDYNEPVFRQLHGNYIGRILTQESYRQNLIKASACLDYEIRSHSMRRGMGKMHPNDPKAKSILMDLYNHSSEKMTNRYIGESDKLEKEYIQDFGEKYKKYVMDGEAIPYIVRHPVSTYDNAELRRYMLVAFGKILDVANETDPKTLMQLYTDLLDGLEELAK